MRRQVPVAGRVLRTCRSDEMMSCEAEGGRLGGRDRGVRRRSFRHASGLLELPLLDGGRDDGVDASASALASRGVGRLERRRLDRVVDDQRRRRPARSRSRPFGITSRVPMTDSGTIGRPASIASRKLPRLEPRDVAVRAARALGEDDERQPVRHQRAPALQDAGAVGMPAIDEQMAAAPQVPAEHREPRQRLLGDDPQLVRQRREDAPGCRRCSGGSTRRRRSCPA